MVQISYHLDPGLRYKCDNINHHERIQLFIVAAAHLPAAQRTNPVEGLAGLHYLQPIGTLYYGWDCQ
jgi:hypothetical protein